MMSLPVWKKIADAADFTLLTRGPKMTHFGLVMASSARMCERCFGVYNRRTAYDVPLPVFLEQHNKTVRLCLSCRTVHYRRNPEPVGPDDDMTERQRYGGQVGVDAHRRHLLALREKREEKHQPERARRRALIRAAFSEAGLTIDEGSSTVNKFIRDGCDRYSWDEIHLVNNIVKGIQAKQAMQQRRLDLAQRLQQHGLQISDDPALCSTYIDHDEGHIDDIVTLIVDSNWFTKYTRYNQLQRLSINETTLNTRRRRRIDPTMLYESNEYGKMRALREYLMQRLMLGQWDDISLDADTPQRPPQSLWQRIQALTKSIWQEQAATRFLEAGVRRSAELLLLDPSQVSSLTNDLFIQVLDQGFMESAGLEEDDLTATPFSSSLQTVLGEDAYMEFIENNRQWVLDKAQAMFINNALKNLPSEIVSFIRRCNQTSTLIPRVYNDMERTFIETEIPAIARRQNVHPAIIINLLKRLKADGYISCAA